MSNAYGDTPAPQPGTRAPDGSVWNGRFWELPPGGPAGRQATHEVRSASDSGSRSRRLAVRRTVAITVGTLAAVAAAAVALPILGEVEDFRGTTFDEVITLGGIAAVSFLAYWIVLLALPYRRWSRGVRSGEPRSAWLDLLRGVLALAPATAVAAAGSAAEDKPLALAGALAAAFFGYVAAGRIPWLLLDHGKHDRLASRGVRWSRALVALLVGVASLGPIALVPGYGGEELVLGAIVMAVALVVTWVGVLLAHVLPVGI